MHTMYKFNTGIIGCTLAAMLGTAFYVSVREHRAAANYRQCLSSQPGERRGMTRLVFKNHNEWLAADNACKPY
jgi:hypothetical protein